MAVIFGTVPSQAVVNAFEADSVRVVRWVDIYEADNVTPWETLVPITDGQITVDMAREERRNIDITFVDLDGALTYGPGAFWYDKILKPYRGVILPDTLQIGYLDLPGVIGNYASVTRSVLGSLTHLEFAVRIRLNAIGVAQKLMGWGSATASLELDSANKLKIFVRKTVSGNIGDAISSVAVPGLAVGQLVWLRGKVTISSAVCEYYYSVQDTNDIDQVTWTQVGTNVTGTNAAGAPLLTSSTTVLFGTNDTTVAGVNGDIYAAYEADTNVKAIEWDAATTPADAASFTAITGQTVTVTGTGGRTTGPVTIPGDWWVAPLGEFMIDMIDRPYFPSTLHVTGRDFTKKCKLDKFTQTTTFAAAANVATTIRTIATNAGITKFNFATPSNTLPVAFICEKATERWKAMKDLADSIAHELFFDSYGNLTLRPFVDPLTAPLYYTFRTGLPNGNLMNYSRNTSDVSLFNHIAVYGDGPSNGLVNGQAENNTITSPTRIALLGRRTMPVPSALVADNTAATALAVAYLKVAALEQYTVSTEALVIPWMEAGTAVEMIVPDAGPSDPTRFLWTDFTIPLGLNSMTGTSRRVTIVG